MIIGPRYKIARRLGAPVFEKTQNQKYTQSLARRGKKEENRGRRQKSDFGLQLLEKQKARYTYLLTERQFSNYVSKAIASKGSTVPTLYSMLERRLDNVVFRLGLASTRAAARQMVSHGHIIVNNKRVTIPSYQVSKGDVIAIREGSKKKTLFLNLDEKLKSQNPPAWLKLNLNNHEAKVEELPTVTGRGDLLFDLKEVVEFYNR